MKIHPESSALGALIIIRVRLSLGKGVNKKLMELHPQAKFVVPPRPKSTASNTNVGNSNNDKLNSDESGEDIAAAATTPGIGDSGVISTDSVGSPMEVIPSLSVQSVPKGLSSSSSLGRRMIDLTWLWAETDATIIWSKPTWGLTTFSKVSLELIATGHAVCDCCPKVMIYPLPSYISNMLNSRANLETIHANLLGNRFVIYEGSPSIDILNHSCTKAGNYLNHNMIISTKQLVDSLGYYKNGYSLVLADDVCACLSTTETICCTFKTCGSSLEDWRKTHVLKLSPYCRTPIRNVIQSSSSQILNGGLFRIMDGSSASNYGA